MKFVNGTRLDVYRGQTTSLSQVLRVFQSICDTVGFAHSRRVIHRDLKPENIMIGPFGEVLIMDWGVAKVLNGRNSEPHGVVIGTKAFMTPEQARGENNNVNIGSDIYSLGAILAFLIGPSAPRPLQAIFGKAMSANQADRYPTAAELSDEVARFLDGRPVQAYSENLAERASRFVAHNKMASILVLTYLALRLLFIFFSRR
jgi:serine/threonine protein kinase